MKKLTTLLLLLVAIISYGQTEDVHSFSKEIVNGLNSIIDEQSIDLESKDEVIATKDVVISEKDIELESSKAIINDLQSQLLECNIMSDTLFLSISDLISIDFINNNVRIITNSEPNVIIPEPIEEPIIEVPDTVIEEPIIIEDTVIIDVPIIITGEYGQEAKGAIPDLLDNKMMLGVSENQGYKWMVESGVDWNSRYMYLSDGWVDNWGWSQDSGVYAYGYMVNSEAMGATPLLEFYPLTYIGYTSIDLIGKIANDTLMNAYFTQFKTLLKRAIEFNKPVVVAIEADGLAFMQMQSEGNSSVYAAISDCGIHELSNLPNTVAGWSLAFLELKKQMGADKVILGMHISHWATGEDLMYQSYEKDMQTSVDEVYSFLAPMGLETNQTGIEYDLLITDPLDRDAGFYEINGSDMWLDMSADANINSKSFNRYAEWLRLWNVKSEKRIMLWQIALGNKYHLNVNNNYEPQEGYKDNRVEYFLEDTSYDNMAKFANSGVIGLLFGAGATYQSTYHNDYDENGDLYMKTKANIFYNNGGMILKR